MRLNRSGEALVRLEQGKTRLLNEALALGHADSLPDDQRQALVIAGDDIQALEAESRLPPDTPSRRSNFFKASTRISQVLRKRGRTLTLPITSSVLTSNTLTPYTSTRVCRC